MKRHGAHAQDESAAVDLGDVAVGKRTLTEGLAGGAGGGMGAPVLQLKPNGEGEQLSGDQSFVDSLLGTDKVSADSGSDQDWMSKGEAVPHKGPYTEADKARLLKALQDRIKYNRREAGELLGEYVDAAVTIVAKYAMDSVKEKNKLADFIKFALVESAAAIAGGVPALLGKKAAEAVLSLAADYIAGESMDDDSVFQDEKDMRALVDKMGKETGNFVEAIVAGLGGADETTAAFWLGGAKLEELGKFRIPEKFDSPPKAKIRGAVAATVASNHHRREIGGQMLSGPQLIETDEVNRQWDYNVVLVDVVAKNGVATPTKARFRTKSKTLREELVGKVTLETLHNVALHIQLSGESHDEGIREVLTALRYTVTEDEVAQFAKAYPAERGTTEITRMPHDGTFGCQGGTLAEHLVLYRWATGDHDLNGLYSEIMSVSEDEGDEAGGGGASRIDYLPMNELAKKVKGRIAMTKLTGAHHMSVWPQITSMVPEA